MRYKQALHQVELNFDQDRHLLHKNPLVPSPPDCTPGNNWIAFNTSTSPNAGIFLICWMGTSTMLVCVRSTKVSSATIVTSLISVAEGFKSTFNDIFLFKLIVF